MGIAFTKTFTTTVLTKAVKSKFFFNLTQKTVIFVVDYCHVASIDGLPISVKYVFG